MQKSCCMMLNILELYKSFIFIKIKVCSQEDAAFKKITPCAWILFDISPPKAEEPKVTLQNLKTLFFSRRSFNSPRARTRLWSCPGVCLSLLQPMTVKVSRASCSRLDRSAARFYRGACACARAGVRCHTI